MDWKRDEIDPPDSFWMERTVEGDWARRCGMNTDGGGAEARDFVKGVKCTFCKSRAASRGEEWAEAEEVKWWLERRAAVLGDDMMDN